MTSTPHARAARISLVALLLSAAVALTAIAPPARAAGVSVDINAQLQGAYVGANDLGSVSAAMNARRLIRLTEGTGASQADKMFADERTISASSTENLDLAGSLTDPLGVAVTFAKVKAIMIIASASNTNDVVVGGAGSNTFTGPFADATDKVAVKPGGVLMIAHPGTGWTVTASTGDILMVGNSGSGTSVTYQVVIIGTSA